MKHEHLAQLPPYSLPPTTISVASDGALRPTGRFEVFRRPLRHLREQMKTLTGWGLCPAESGAPNVTRKSLPLDENGLSLSTLSAGEPSAQQILFIHGSPGRAEEWRPYLENCPADQYRIAVDRAGYGESQPSAPCPTIAAQADAIAPLLTPRCIIVGYSYGGSVALQLAADHPDLVAGLLLVGCPIDPQLEYVNPLQRVAATSIVARLLPRALNASNIELLPFKSDLADLLPKLSAIKSRVTVMQGLLDTLVVGSNADMLAAQLNGSAAPRVILIQDGDHYLPWTHRLTVEQALGFVLRDSAPPTYAW
ncbi:alpha/beta fold hydrolase [Primorskyibacter sedentarius]|nr:alpha/beta hydrolase [Primorskyibacter sedentarius]